MWIIIPVVFWTYQNNMMEATMSVFTLSSILFIVKYFNSNKLVYIIISGLSIFFSFMVKGLPGLYPLIGIFLYYIIWKEISFIKMLKLNIVLIFTPIIIFVLIIYLDNDAYSSMMFYFKKRLFGRIENFPVVNNHFYILKRLFSELIPLYLLTIFVIIIAKIKGLKINFRKQKKFFLFFLLLGFSGTLPLMATKVQKGFYMSAALPMFALAFASFLTLPIIKLIDNINVNNKIYKKIKLFFYALFVFSIVYSISKIGDCSRDSDKLNDVYLIGKEVPGKINIYTEYSIYRDWSTQEYFVRYFDIYLVTDTNKFSSNYFITTKEKTELDGFKLINLQARKYNLFKKILN